MSSILGGGVSGTNATLMAAGMGADVTVVDRSPDVLRRIIATFGTPREDRLFHPAMPWPSWWRRPISSSAPC